MSEYKVVEILLMKPVRYGKSLSGDTLSKVLPIIEYTKLSTTIIELKRQVLDKVKHIYKNFDQ
jgi:hypothetical protein